MAQNSDADEIRQFKAKQKALKTSDLKEQLIQRETKKSLLRPMKPFIPDNAKINARVTDMGKAIETLSQRVGWARQGHHDIELPNDTGQIDPRLKGKK